MSKVAPETNWNKFAEVLKIITKINKVKLQKKNKKKYYKNAKLKGQNFKYKNNTKITPVLKRLNIFRSPRWNGGHVHLWSNVVWCLVHP